LENKTILTFLSQGAVGGALGYFLLTACFVVVQSNDENFLYLVILPIIFAFGAVLGCITAIFIWLAGVFLQRKLGFAVRALIVLGAMTGLGVAFSYLTDESPDGQESCLWLAGFVSLMVLSIVLMTGSGIRPCHLIFVGAGPRSARHNFGSWLSLPAGFLLRVASVFGLFEALMTLALWISARRVDWLESTAAPEHLPAIVLAVLYFATSAYFSISRPRKFFLLPTTIILNLPLACLIVHLRLLATPEANFLSYLLLAFICLWAVYTLTRMIAPGSVRRVVIDSWNKTDARCLSPSGVCQVQL